MHGCRSVIGSLLIALGPGITTAVLVAFGPELPRGVAKAIAARLSPFAFPLELNFGRTAACLNYPGETMERIGSEGFVVARNASVVCAVGNSSIGSAYATFRVAEMLGFSFLHPLAAVTPAALNATSIPDGTHEVHASPALAFRGFHIHTEHPLELVEVLQGAEAVLADGSTVAWDAMVSDVASLFEWLVANRQNHVQWILLASPEWKRSGWVDSAQRQRRLRRLTDLGRSFGLTVGADIPIAEVQQRAWYMVTRFVPHDVPSMVAQIRARLEWLFDGAGFDYLASESGTSEFTHPECSAMLALINATANCAQAYHGKRAYIKVHASTGQRCPSIHDPRDGAPINFNFLPMLASKSMGVLPHTVQAYALDEPTDGAYGNDNFSDIRAFMAWEAANDTARRPVVFHPETNYWVNVDIDVPLFLPLQGERRLHDLRSLAFEEVARKAPLDRRVSGQLIFDSGWEWGSWLSDVIAARAAKQAHVPYRNSKLTSLLEVLPHPSPALGQVRCANERSFIRFVLAQDSLGGDSKTLMLVHCRPTADNIGETLCTLNFASVRALGSPPARASVLRVAADRARAFAARALDPQREFRWEHGAMGGSSTERAHHKSFF